MELQIYDKKGIKLDGVMLKNYTWSKSYGSFDSKITGNIVYEGKGLDTIFLLGCYVVFPKENVKYTIINAPSSESFLYVRDNNSLNGNNRYSYEFYAPEYFLTQFEFRDLPLDNTESEYRGGQTSFYLCCTIDELLKRIQKNLDEYNATLPIKERWLIQFQGENKGINNILPIKFEHSSIADVLKKIEDIYDLKYFVQYLKKQSHFGQNRIFIGDIINSMPVDKYFEFKQAGGLTSSIRVSKKEPMVTKYYPQGSEHNVPFRYPIIIDTITKERKEHSYYSERIMPQFWVNAVKNKVLNGSENPIISYLLAQNPSYPNNSVGITPNYPNTSSVTWENPYNPQLPFTKQINYDDIFPTIKDAKNSNTGEFIDRLRIDSFVEPIIDYNLINGYGGVHEQTAIYVNGKWELVFPFIEYFFIEVSPIEISNIVGDEFSWDKINMYDCRIWSNIKASNYSAYERRVFENYNQTSYQNQFDFIYYDYDLEYFKSFFVNGVWTAESPNRDLQRFPNGNIKESFIISFKKYYYIYEASPLPSNFFVHDVRPYSDLLKDNAIIFKNNTTNFVMRLFFSGVMFQGYNIGTFNDEIDWDEGTLKQEKFLIPLKKLGFDLYASAIENEEMYIHMTSGSCQGSKFKIAVDWEAWANSFYLNGVDFSGRRYESEYPNNPTNHFLFPNTTFYEHNLLCYKDIETWGKNYVQPTKLRYPKKDDTFVITGINLPDVYIENAQIKLQKKAFEDLIELNKEKFDYQFNISNIFINDHSEFEDYLDTNIKIRFKYANSNEILESNFQSISITFNLLQQNNPLPIYDVKLSDVLKKNKNFWEKDDEENPQFKAISAAISSIIRDKGINTQKTNNSLANLSAQQRISNSTILNILNNKISKIDNLFLFDSDSVIVFNEIVDILILPFNIGGNRYELNIKDSDGIVINAPNFYELSPMQTTFDILVTNVEEGKRYFIEILYSQNTMVCPTTTEYTLNFYVNEMTYKIVINSTNNNPITRIVFVNNGIFTESNVQYGINSGWCNSDVYNIIQ